MKQKAKALIIIALMIFAALAIVWHNKSQTYMTAAGGTLSAELSQMFGTTVKVGKIEVGTFDSLSVSDFELYDHEGEKIAVADQLEVSFSPLSIIQGHTAAAAISEITIFRPYISLNQYPDKTWNIEKILKSKGSDTEALDIKLTIKDGTANISNELGTWLIETVNGSLEIHQHSLSNIKLSLNQAGASVALTGNWNSQRGSLTIKAKNLMLANYQPFFQYESSTQLLGGTASEAELLLSRNNGQTVYDGEARIENGSLNVDGIAVRDLQGMITFTDNYIYLFNTAKVFEQPLKLRGKIATDTVKPVLDLSVSSEGFDLSAIETSYSISGKVDFNAQITGMSDNPTIDGHFSLEQTRVYDQTIERAEIDLIYVDKIINIKSFEGTTFGGQLTAQGSIEPESQRYNLHVTGKQLDTVLMSNYLPGLDGYVDFDINASGNESFAETSIHGTAAIGAGKYQGVEFTNLAGSFYKNGRNAVIDYINIGLGQGIVTASGTITDDKLSLDVRGNGLPLNLVTKYEPKLNMDGTANFNGTVTGSIISPKFQTVFSAANGQVLNQPFTHAQGNLIVSPEMLEITEIVLNEGITQHYAQGIVGLKGEHSLNIKVVTKQARAENLVKLLAPGERLTGNVDNEVVLSGTLDNFNAVGNVTLTDGSFRGFLIAKGAGSYQKQNGITTIKDFAINSLNTQVKISGIIDQSSKFDLDIAAKDVDISKLHFNFPYPIDGQIDFTGKLRGTSDSPIFGGQLTANSLSFNSEQLKQVEGNISIEGSQIDVPSLCFSQGAGKFNFSGGINLLSSEVYGDIGVENGQLAALLAIINLPAKEIDGQLNGRVLVSGNTSRPNMWVTGSLTKGSLKNYPLDNVEIDIALSNNIITVNKFMAKQGQGILAIEGSADLDGPLNFEVGGRDIDAGLITAWLDAKIETKGKLNFAAQVSGTTESPKAAVSLEIAGGGVANATFDSLYGLLLLDQGSIHVNQIMLTKGQYRASAYGIIPVAALTAEGRKQGDIQDQMDLKVRLDEADLSILPLLTKEVSWAAGRTQGELTIGGTLVHPSINGIISVQNGVLKLASLLDPIQKVVLDIRFNGDKINVKTFEGVMGAGSYNLTGWAQLRGVVLSDYDFTLKLDKLGVNSKYFKGPVDGALSLVSGSKRPKLSGKLTFENNIIDIPYIPEFTSDSPNIELDVELIAGKKVRLYNPYLYDIWAEGRVNFKGSTKRPDVSGKITATRGTVSYLRTSFKVKEASAEFTQFASFEPIIKLEAETRLEKTKILLAVNGPISTMDFNLTAEPAMSQQEIMSLLTLRSRYFDKQNGSADGRDTGLGRDELLTILDAGLQMRFVSELENIVREAFGLDEFRIVRDTLLPGQTTDDKNGLGYDRDREVYNLEFGKYLTDRFMLSYTMGVGHDINKIAFRYDLSKRMSFTGSYDQLNRHMFGIETRYKF
ncbi:translocation/assembly module TamB domain-containing protein [Dendrosporobacter sp. 1207_IL3150]|uniref:translocation/assembly module TamB domain-containing protein n=1 Tax=Dendrosporobacter sp. 1207_IL3150 TaxID=3084054 RepID=UPI002FDB299F